MHQTPGLHLTDMPAHVTLLPPVGGEINRKNWPTELGKMGAMISAQFKGQLVQEQTYMCDWDQSARRLPRLSEAALSITKSSAFGQQEWDQEGKYYMNFHYK